ncbi:hypothetical protein BC939DRAFT_444475 [Gamsiella multidivaricata]|uniref:uncharacterized protein n=1 Tax=Gamsiella multidivaricata TaxID=101098 RepID=UPI002220BEC5|nr:uncharacterized protein BC939DRAFT_444475 [Gamsiella multidivaricata]KAG0368363.1 hypothetical protein BGZ54_002079 [Gamsiella multidivaricata]KAI7828077.1 hypothetical protein BC939DRAFT_444475 [Gamsiella multidivaricata]
MFFKSLKCTAVIAAVAVLALAATVMAGPGAGKPGSPDNDHSNYGDMGKAKEFAKEHMGEKGKNLTEKEELMMLFSLHDSNKDGFLDGIELRAAFSDYHQGAPESTLSLQQMLDMIDHVIAEDDTDNDGKISWEEYLISQKYHEG